MQIVKTQFDQHSGVVIESTVELLKHDKSLYET